MRLLLVPRMKLRTVAVAIGALGSKRNIISGPPFACDPSAHETLPKYCNTSFPAVDRINDLISQLTLQEKVVLLGNTAGRVESQGIREYQWWSEALHGVGISPGVTFKEPTPAATSFAQVVTTSHSFDLWLVHNIARDIGVEARAFANLGNAGLTFWAPNINIFRDPRWGRGQETPGEDPLFSSLYAVAFVRGMQEGEDPRYLKTSACCKHYAAYSVETLYNGTTRHEFDAIVTPQDASDTYLPAFRSCVLHGNVSSLMCSYNSINGVPACADDHLLNGLARSEWGFDGYVTSDCGAIKDVLSNHNYTSTPEDTCAVTLRAGCDLDCGDFYQSNMVSAYKAGKVTDADLDTALRHLLRVQFRLGMFDPPDQQIYTKYGPERVNTAEHKALALESARRGMVLLKNRKASSLPLPSLSKLAVIGPHANASLALLGNYYGRPETIITPLQGLQRYVAQIDLSPGCSIAEADTSGFDSAMSAARSADATVLFVGLDQSIESEDRDRISIELPGLQRQLITQVAAVSRGPVVVVVIGGGAVDLAFAKDDDNVDAILFAGYPGQSGGQAIAETLFGDNNPSGRLTQTFYTADFTQMMGMGDMNMRPKAGVPSGRTYRFYTGEVVYPFGFGLSYSHFHVGPARCLCNASVAVSSSRASLQGLLATGDATHAQGEEAGDVVLLTKGRDNNPTAEVVAWTCVQATNLGTRAGRYTLLGFLHPPSPLPSEMGTQPSRFLAAFGPIGLLSPGATRRACVGLNTEDVSLADVHGDFRVINGTWRLTIDDFAATITV